MKILYKGGSAEIVEKKSRFIATIEKAETEEEASRFFEKLKKENWNASHNCTAFVVGEKQPLQRCSDDGEPSGTAGRPMLDVLLGEKVNNIAVVVTRYFGGTLLGTGGLVRAYSKAVQEGLKNCQIIDKQPGIIIPIQTDYTGLGKLQYLMASQSVPIMDTEYTDNVIMKILAHEQEAEKIKADITEATNGKARIMDGTKRFYGIINKEIILF